MLKSELERQNETQAARIRHLEENVEYYRDMSARLKILINEQATTIKEYQQKESESQWSNEVRGKQIEAILEYYQKMVEGGIEEPLTQRIISELITNNQLIF